MRSFETKIGPKQLCRDMLVLQAKNHIPQVNKILTLPGKEALCVKTFKKSFKKVNIVGIERDEEIFNYITDKHGINCLNCDVREYVESCSIKSQHHDIVFLDYYSYLNDNIIKDLKVFISNDNICHKDKPFILGITLMKAMRGNKNATLDFIKNNLYNIERKEIINSLENVKKSLISFISNTRPDLYSIEMLWELEYQANIGSTPMYFLLLKITK